MHSSASLAGIVNVLQVRIEDDIIVTEDGMELMTDVPRTVEEIETIMIEGRATQTPLPQQQQKQQ